MEIIKNCFYFLTCLGFFFFLVGGGWGGGMWKISIIIIEEAN